MKSTNKTNCFKILFLFVLHIFLIPSLSYSQSKLDQTKSENDKKDTIKTKIVKTCNIVLNNGDEYMCMVNQGYFYVQAPKLKSNRKIYKITEGKEELSNLGYKIVRQICLPDSTLAKKWNYFIAEGIYGVLVDGSFSIVGCTDGSTVFLDGGILQQPPNVYLKKGIIVGKYH